MSARRQATLDHLTGLANHRRLVEVLADELRRGPVALLLIDLDDFKAVNDTYGHQAGDDVLRAAGAVLRERCRSSDLPARYGGEELAIVVPGGDLDGALALAEDVRTRIAALRVPVPDGGTATVTASIGVGCHPDHAHDVTALVAAADAALYAAKRAGKNRVAAARA